ncbi:MAG: peptide ABC transporter substrate-binding protein [Thomasclavelia sp.]|nr:peptide ABC transporter substrate-binding protein [Thomasclavelia sp.]
MKKLLSYALSALMCLSLLTGCGSSSSADVKVAVGGDTADLDPAIVDDSITANVLNQCYEGLYKLDKEGNVVTSLATDMPEISADGLTYTIKFNSKAKWSNGKKVKASDFVYAWKRAVSLGMGTAYYSTFISNYIAGATDGTKIADLKDFGAKAIDDNTIQITLKAKCDYFTKLLTSTVFYPVNEAYVSKHGETKSTWGNKDDVPYNGAFKVTSVNTKSKIEMEKNDQYYDKKEVKLNSLEFQVMSDMDSETSAFQSGEIDFATSVNNDTVESSKSLKKNVYLIDPFVCNYYILINSGDENTNKALKDVDIRNALSLAVDRSDVLKALGYGDNASELNGFIPKGIPGANGDFRTEQDAVKKLAYSDLNEAKTIMASKGYSDSNMLKLTYTYNDNTMHKNVATALQQELKKAYIDLKVVSSEKEAFFAARDKGDFELCRHAMTADYMDPMTYLSMYYGKDLAGNTVDDDKYEALITEAEALSGTERMNKLHEAENYLVGTQHYLIPLFSYSEKILKNPKLTGVTSSPEGHWDLTRASLKD